MQRISTQKSRPEPTRCTWAKNELAILYHDGEWGVPLHDDQRLFEFIVLEGAQAGLSWDTILQKRKNYRAAFDKFDPKIVARYDARKMRRLLADAGIVRNRLKIVSAVENAKAFLDENADLAAEIESQIRNNAGLAINFAQSGSFDETESSTTSSEDEVVFAEAA